MTIIFLKVTECWRNVFWSSGRELEYVDLRATNSFCKRSREGKVKKRPFHADRFTSLDSEAGKRQFSRPPLPPTTLQAGINLFLPDIAMKSSQL
jgi:hypothetical protein